MTTAILLLAGTSERFNHQTLKQYTKINNKEVYKYSLERLVNCSHVDNILLVINKESFLDVKNEIEAFDYHKKIFYCQGGLSRQESVFNALSYIKENLPAENIIIHDSARPLADSKLFVNVINSLKYHDSVTCAIDVFDTLTFTNNKVFIGHYLKRDNFMKIQTPQGFKFDIIYKAHLKARENKFFNASDDSFLVSNLKEKVYYESGSPANIKITTADDLIMVSSLLKEQYGF
ncbi:MAG TPA: IspD/TarI family cytidylyltransferase [Candidatus Onthovivens sp.]|nr:IspD/TarI family cytidylyltransferase [Candidatus Onthovivens sp.]